MTRLMPKWMWWKNGKCTVEILRTGHYPNTVIVELPLGTQTEIEIAELETPDGRDTGKESQTSSNENP